MKIIVTESQTKKQTEIEYDEDFIRNYSRILNTILKRKYSWFENLELDKLTYVGVMGYIAMKGTMEVDIEWGAKQFREYHYSAYFPGNVEFLSLGDIIGGDLSRELSEIIKFNFQMLTGFSPKNLSWSWIMLRFKED